MIDFDRSLKNSALFQGAAKSNMKPNAILALIIFFALWGGSLFLGRMVVMPIIELLPKDSPLQIAASSSLRKILICGIQIAIFFAWVKFIEKRSISTLGFKGAHRIQAYLLSAALGFGAMTLIILCLVLLGAFKLTLPHAFSFSGLCAPVLVAMLGWAVQSASEEIAVRGWLVPVIGARYSPLQAVLLTGLVFGAIHLFNAGATVLSFTNLTLSGIFFALYAVNMGNIWGACGLHMGWNFAQGNIYGVAISGEHSVDTIIRCDSIGDDILTGGKFGAEASILTTLFFLCGILIMVTALYRRHIRTIK